MSAHDSANETDQCLADYCWSLKAKQLACKASTDLTNLSCLGPQFV
jgi:hypothetical protein